MIALAYKQMPGGSDEPVYSVRDESDLILLGFLAFLDPPKDTATKALKQLHSLSVDVKVLTGDNETVTAYICKEVGMPVEHLLPGSQIDAMNETELAAGAWLTVSPLAKTPGFVPPPSAILAVSCHHAHGLCDSGTGGKGPVYSPVWRMATDLDNRQHRLSAKRKMEGGSMRPVTTPYALTNLLPESCFTSFFISRISKVLVTTEAGSFAMRIISSIS